MRFAFLSGLPRSGSTLYSSLLNQHPDVYASPSSPVCDLMWNARQGYVTSEQAAAYPEIGAAGRLTFGMLNGYYSERPEGVIVDKCWTWGTPGNVSMLRESLGDKPRIIVMARPVVEILASFVRLMREWPGSPLEPPASWRPQDDARCDWLMRPGGDIDRALWGVHHLRATDAAVCLEVTYERLCKDPAGVMADSWDFLGVPPLDPVLDNVVNVTRERDADVHGIPVLHEVRSVVEATAPPPESVLSDYVMTRYSGM